jgi:uncharacterized protein (DUF924 family)
MSAAEPEAEEVLAFWFGALDADGRADAAHGARWWRKDPAFDAEIRARFGALHAAALTGGREAWRAAPRTCLAYVIVLDQFSRNLFRGDAQAFAGDTRALATARQAVDRGDDRALACDERGFLYMPFMHSEDRAVQQRSVQLYAAWLAEAPAPLHERLTGNLKYAQQHRDIVERFGRFPHRNAVLGRASTPEELTFLEQPGSSF